MKRSKSTNITINYAGLSDIGKKRTNNQDSYGQFPENTFDSLVPGGLMFVVADGMGGHAKGEEASRMAVEILSREYYASKESDISRSLVHSVQDANAAIFEKATGTNDEQQMGTTVSTLLITGKTAHIAHVGDSRIYLVRDGKLIQMTTDHTKVEELKRAGIINKEEAKIHPERSVLQRALGVREHVRVDISSDLELRAGDTFILCSDGLAMVKKEELLGNAQKEKPQVACQKLINLANERGGVDNSTVQIIKIEKSVGGKVRGKHEMRMAAIGLSALLLILIFATIYISFQYSETELQSNVSEISNHEEDSGTIADMFTKANKFVDQRQYEDAIILYQQILILNPLETDALKELDQIAARFVREGEQYQRQGEPEKALGYLRQASEIRPQDKKLADLIKTIEEM